VRGMAGIPRPPAPPPPLPPGVLAARSGPGNGRLRVRGDRGHSTRPHPARLLPGMAVLPGVVHLSPFPTVQCFPWRRHSSSFPGIVGHGPRPVSSSGSHLPGRPRWPDSSARSRTAGAAARWPTHPVGLILVRRQGEGQPVSVYRFLVLHHRLPYPQVPPGLVPPQLVIQYLPCDSVLPVSTCGSSPLHLTPANRIAAYILAPVRSPAGPAHRPTSRRLQVRAGDRLRGWSMVCTVGPVPRPAARPAHSVAHDQVGVAHGQLVGAGPALRSRLLLAVWADHARAGARDLGRCRGQGHAITGGLAAAGASSEVHGDSSRGRTAAPQVLARRADCSRATWRPSRPVRRLAADMPASTMAGTGRLR